MKDRLTPDLIQLHAYVDGQLDAQKQLEVEAYLVDNDEARARVQDYQSINDMLRQLYDPILDEPIPPTLQIAQPRRPNRKRLFTQMAAAAILVTIGLFSGFYLGVNQVMVATVDESEAEHVVGEAVTAYTVYAPEVRHPVEVSGDQRDHLVAWLSKRMGRNIIAPHLENLDMRLLGGRLLASDDGPGALMMYEDPQGKRIIFYACLTDEKSSAFHYSKQRDVSVFYWVDNAVIYAIAGEIEKERLRPMAEMAYNQLTM